ncbi:MAG TPA: DedA family protein [Pseudomonadales bacterium]|nr:DedA family protein [Pseudomonadales bacterium]
MPEFDDLRSSEMFALLSAHPDWVGVAVLAIAFVESFAIAGMLVPGVALLAAAAFVAGSGTLALGPTLACAFVGAVLGDGSSFLIGRHFSATLRTHGWLARRRHWVERGEAFVAQHGVTGIVLGRFVGPIRPIIPLVAGMLGMRGGLFLGVNLLSALVWAPVYVLPGFLFGASLVEKLQPPTGWLTGLVVIVCVTWLTIHAVILAWRSGTTEGALVRRFGGAERSWLARPLVQGSTDTWLSLGAALLTLLAVIGLLAAALSTSALADWRRFLVELAALTLSQLRGA